MSWLGSLSEDAVSPIDQEHSVRFPTKDVQRCHLPEAEVWESISMVAEGPARRRIRRWRTVSASSGRSQ